jgi:hypothetical protein
MHRRPGQIPLAKWLTSHNPVLREKAETVLYHLGPDAGEVLLHAAEQESKWAHQRRALLVFPVEVLSALGLFYFLRLFAEVQSTLLLGMLAYIAARTVWQVSERTVSRRTRLRTIALALARRNDLRSVGPLIEVWRPVAPGGWQVRDDDVEHELNRLLPKFMAQNRLTLRNDKLALVRRKVRRLTRGTVGGGDLPDARADLLITLLQLLARTGGEKNRHVLRRLARPRPAAAPNALLIHDAAEVLLTVAEVPAETSAAVLPAPFGSAQNPAIVPTTTPPPAPLTLRRP